MVPTRPTPPLPGYGSAGRTACSSRDSRSPIDVNIKGVLYGIAAALPHMKAQKSGHIINVSSVAGHLVRPGGAVYSATKHAVRVISEGLREEVKPYNIRSTIISPGAVATELPDSITEPDVAAGIRDFYQQYAIPASSFAEVVVFAMSQPEEVESMKSCSGRPGRNCESGTATKRTERQRCERHIEFGLTRCSPPLPSSLRLRPGRSKSSRRRS